ncbi:hypothetical protein ZWY2020_022959 [Hordeum vulgare]|nr:hypothetical protein ZWY2020_022959 [Hordeum vulgare]
MLGPRGGRAALEEGGGLHLAAVGRSADLPKGMNDTTINDNKVDGHSNDKEAEGIIVDGNGTEVGQIIVTTIGGQNGKPKQKVSYMAERVVGTGLFGVVYQAKCLETGETVVIKKVLQDKRYKNRELQTM